jgi:hypothetical protein
VIVFRIVQGALFIGALCTVTYAVRVALSDRHED